jgi:hypothetical protein
MPDASNTSATWPNRARAYLAANCSICHQPGGTAPTSRDFRWEASNAQMIAIDVPPGNGDPGIEGALAISTRDVDKSVLLQRIKLRDGLFQMPPLGTYRPDREGIELIRQQVISLRSRAVVPHVPLLLLDKNN